MPKVTRDYAEALFFTVTDFDCDFDPKYLETQLIIADEGSEKEHVATVIARQLVRETKLADQYFSERELARRSRKKMAEDVVQEYLGFLPSEFE